MQRLRTIRWPIFARSEAPRLPDMLRPASGFEPARGGPPPAMARFSWVGFPRAVIAMAVIVGVGGAGFPFGGRAVPAPDQTTRGSLSAGVAAEAEAAPARTPMARPGPAQPAANPRIVAIPPLPNVQRPTELSASAMSMAGANEAVAERGTDGGFIFDAVVNGSHLRMLFDTGASVVGLRSEDAARLGIPVSRLNYSAKVKTANGTADVAPVVIDTMLIGNITLRNVSAFVAKEGLLPENLLGQTFLARLSGFNLERNLLILRGR